MTIEWNNGPLPTFFRACILEARFGRSSRSAGYSTAGFHLAMHIRSYVDDEVVEDALESDDAACALWDVITHELPRCAALVPVRRREKFVEGIAAAIEQERV